MLTSMRLCHNLVLKMFVFAEQIYHTHVHSITRSCETKHKAINIFFQTTGNVLSLGVLADAVNHCFAGHLKAVSNGVTRHSFCSLVHAHCGCCLRRGCLHSYDGRCRGQEALGVPGFADPGYCLPLRSCPLNPSHCRCKPGSGCSSRCPHQGHY